MTDLKAVTFSTIPLVTLDWFSDTSAFYLVTSSFIFIYTFCLAFLKERISTDVEKNLIG